LTGKNHKIIKIIKIMPPHQKTYKNVLVRFLSYRDGVEYPTDAEFDADHIISITADNIVRWFKFKAYGSPEPDDDARPKFIRHSTLHFWKKALSSFFPNKHLGYNVTTQEGNPTKAPVDNDLIKTVKKLEVRSEGVPSQARRDFTLDEFRTIISIAQQSDLFSVKVRLPTICKLQLHLISRVDDTCHILSNELRVYSSFPFALGVRLRWTKNCLEERDAPEQILLGSMDGDFCVLAALGIYLCYVLEFSNALHSEFLFCDTEDTPIRVKAQVGVNLRKALTHDQWVSLQKRLEAAAGKLKGGVGTHSIRKLAATLARLMGCSQDETENRGRWRNSVRVSARYTAIDLPVVDATVAAALCIGGAVKYVVRDDAPAVTDDWMIAEFVPLIAAKFGDRVAEVLGKALLWSINEPEMRKQIPDNLYQRMISRYSMIRLDDTTNPIEKKKILVYSIRGRLMIDEKTRNDDDNNNDKNATTTRMDEHNPTMQAVLAQNHAIRIQNAEILSTMRQQHDHMKG
jgi:hypothetical protein